MTLAVNIAQSGSSNVTFRNRIINGAMVFDQRNAGASVTPSSNPTYTLDRWNLTFSQGSKFSIQQTPSATETGFATRVGAGFTNYLAATVVSSVSVGAGDYFAIQQLIEGLNVSDLAWGTANAKTITLSFLVRSSLTGTFGGALSNSAGDRSYPFSYTISTANTWEQKSVTIAGDTSGTWLTTNGVGMYVRFGLGAGATFSGTAGAWAASNYFSATSAVSVVGTGSATFYITGVQLEAGTTASPFEYRQYGTEYNLCLRYYWHGYMAAGNVHYFIPIMPTNPGTSNVGQIPLTAALRTTPVFVLYPAYNTGGSWNLNNAIVNNTFTGIPVVYNYTAGNSPSSVAILITVSSGMNIGYPVYFYNNTSVNGYIALNAEL